jgi:hypothetical protein
MTNPSLVDRALAVLLLAQEEPGRAIALATELQRQAVDDDCPAAETRALRALGLAARAQDRINDAITWLRRSVEVAEANSEVDLGTEARISLASCLAFNGDSHAALAVLDDARPSPALAPVVASNRAGILSMLGRYDEAVAGCMAAVEAFREMGDGVRESRALTNRGLVYVYTGRFDAADADLARAEALAVSAGLPTEAAGCGHNRGFAASRRGDLPTALALFDRAAERYAAAGLPAGPLALDRAECLLAAGLVEDAAAAANAAVRAMEGSGNNAGLAEGLLLVADINALAGEHERSGAAAAAAADLLERQDRPAWAALARAAGARATLGALTSPPGGGLSTLDAGADVLAGAAAEQAARAAIELDRAGLHARGVEAHACAGELWLLAGVEGRAEGELTAAAAGRTGGTAWARAAGWEAEALRRLAAGDRRGGLAALRASLAVVASQQASLGASELRAHIALHAQRTAARGLRVVVDRAPPRRVLAWMERQRANALRSWLTRPPPDHPSAAWLDELRTLTRAVEAGALDGRDVRDLLRRQAAVERRVRQAAWTLPPAGAAVNGEGGPPTRRGRTGPLPTGGGLVPGQLDRALGERALVELAAVDGMLHAVVVAGGRSWHRRIGPLTPILAESAHLRFALSRRSYGLDGSPGPGPAGSDGGLRVAADRLDDLLVTCLLPLIGSRPVVIVPTGELHAAPWGALPSLAGRPVSVAPSARAWMSAASAALRVLPPADRSVLVVAGPGLASSSAEAATVASFHPPGTVVLEGDDARAAKVLDALGRCDIAHIAAHASFRADNGMWSSLRLADGPLSVYELERLAHGPALVILSACQSGLSTVRPGDELLGLVAALLALGTAAVIASVVPVSDAATPSLMADLHRALASGMAPAEALTAAGRGSGDAATLAAFVCFGAG